MFVGIDAGGSGTRAAWADGDGRVLGSAVGGPALTTGDVATAVEGALAPLVRGAGVRVVVAGVRGLSVAGRGEAFRAAIGRWLPSAEVRLVNDAQIALWGALAGEAGVAVLAGTGSIALARAADGREARAGGFGALLGDEGSAFWLGREAVRATLRGDQTRLTELVRAHAGADVLGWVYDGGQPVDRLASLAPLVAQAAGAGDTSAGALLHEAARELARLADTAAQGVWGNERPAGVRVVRCGGVWQAGPSLIGAFEDRLAWARHVPPVLPPTGGALLLALGTTDPRVVERLAAGRDTSA